MTPITFQIRQDEVEASARYLAKHHRGVRGQLRRNRAIGAVMFAVALIAFISFAYKQPALSVVPLALVGAVAWYFIYGYIETSRYARRVFKITANGNKNFARTCTVAAEDDGLASTSELGSGKLLWSAIEQVGTDDHYVYLLTASGGAITIPRLAFGSMEAAQEFAALVQARRAASPSI